MQCVAGLLRSYTKMGLLLMVQIAAVVIRRNVVDVITTYRSRTRIGWNGEEERDINWHIRLRS